MKVSVIVPAYKFANYLEQALLSALWQKTNFEFEVLVRDDFSQDGSEEIIERLTNFYPNLKHFRATENLGFHKNIPFLLSQSHYDRKAKYMMSRWMTCLWKLHTFEMIK